MLRFYFIIGTPQVVVCNTDGDIKGFNLTTNTSEFEVKNTVQKKDNEAINKMNLEIHKLKAELDDDNFEKKTHDSNVLAMNVPHTAKVEITQGTTDEAACITFKVQSPLIIRCVILFSDKLFEEGTFVSSPSKPSSSLVVPLYSEKNLE